MRFSCGARSQAHDRRTPGKHVTQTAAGRARKCQKHAERTPRSQLLPASGVPREGWLTMRAVNSTALSITQNVEPQDCRGASSGSFMASGAAGPWFSPARLTPGRSPSELCPDFGRRSAGVQAELLADVPLWIFAAHETLATVTVGLARRRLIVGVDTLWSSANRGFRFCALGGQVWVFRFTHGAAAPRRAHSRKPKEGCSNNNRPSLDTTDDREMPHDEKKCIRCRSSDSMPKPERTLLGLLQRCATLAFSRPGDRSGVI
jgi:hypothetical protein